MASPFFQRRGGEPAADAGVDRLGASGAVRFVVQTERGYGDDSELRHRMLGDLSVDELLERMQKSNREGRRSTKGSERSKKRSGVGRRAP